MVVEHYAKDAGFFLRFATTKDGHSRYSELDVQAIIEGILTETATRIETEVQRAHDQPETRDPNGAPPSSPRGEV